jgi:hypothetical protein
MLRRLLVTLFAIGASISLTLVLLRVIDGKLVSAQEDNKNCPEGFHWERMSGQCCVQDYETIPEHGRLGYTGNSICDDGYVGVYQGRMTTNREGVPGCPNYNEFAFLTECLPQGSGAGAALSGGGVIRNASEALYHGGSGPSPEDLAATGAVTSIILMAGGGVIVLRRPSTSLKESIEQLQKELDERHANEAIVRHDIERALREEIAAREEWERMRRIEDDLKFKQFLLREHWKDLFDRLERLEGNLRTQGKVCTLAGILSILGSLTTGAGGTVLSIGMSAAGIVGGEAAGSAQDVRAAAQRALADAEAKMNAADDSLRKHDRVMQIAEDRVRDTRGRVDALENEWRDNFHRDVWYRRDRPALPGESR